MPDINGKPIPGERLATAIMNGQVSGEQLGRALFDLLPTLPFEQGFPLPRLLVKAYQAPPQAVIPAAPAVLQPAIPAQPAPVVLPAPARVSGQLAPRQHVPGVDERRPVRTLFVKLKELPGL